MSVKYIERINAMNEKTGFPPYRWAFNEDCPWAKPDKPLNETNVALISTGGTHMVDQEPFNPKRDDYTLRFIPKDADVKELRFSHGNYDHTDAEKDPNCVFPIERLNELSDSGYIGNVADFSVTMMGRLFKRGIITDEMVPSILNKLKEMKADIALLVPA